MTENGIRRVDSASSELDEMNEEGGKKYYNVSTL
jgi:hypothetical protein